MPDSWSAFPDAPEVGSADPWTDFPDAEPSPAWRSTQRRAPPYPAFTGPATAVDGDTLRLGSGSLRLWGVDAPEMKQPGWNRDGTSTPVGRQSRDALTNLLGDYSPLIGPTQGMSYGRKVASAKVGGFDLGEQMVRSGNALADPRFLLGDAARDYRFQLMQAERLARQNKLGPLNDAYVRRPAEHRADPGFVVPRETVAQFFDTPTPPSGLPADIEQRIMAMTYDPDTPIEDVVAYARENGGIITPENIQRSRAYYLEHGDKGGMEYLPPEQVLTDAGDGATGAAIRSYGEGFLAGGLGELGAIPDTLGLTPGRESVWNSDRRWADIYANNLAQNESILGYDEFAHPWASTGGEIGGALTSGFMIPYGQGARTIPQLARVGAVYGGGAGFLGTEGGLPQRAQGAAVGTPAGAILNAAGGKAIEMAPYLAKGWRALRGRSAMQAVEEATERLPSQIDWEDFPDAPDIASPGSIAMDAEPIPSVSADIRQRDYLDVAGPVRPQRLDQPPSEAQLRAASEDIHPRDILPSPVAPANEASALPSIQASEEWSAEAVSRAGNIRLDNLDSPQDINRALTQTNDRIGFDAATRGRVTQAETERLASELNMTAEQLLSRRKGQAFNAEEALAARQILAKSGNELVGAAKRIQALDDPGDELLADFRRKWLRHVAIQEQVSGATAEAGRALAQFKIAANSRAVRGDILGALVRAGGGKDNLKDAAETLIEAVEAGPGVFNALAEKAAKPKLRNKLSELYINMLLSGPQTHAVNMASNALTALAQIPEHATAALIGGARQALSRDAIDRVMGSEVGARAFGFLQGAKEGARLFARSLRTGDASDLTTKIEGNEYRAISGLKGDVIRVPTRLLTAEDELFKGIAHRMELNAQAVRIAREEGLKGAEAKRRIAELSANPTDAMLERALDYGRYLTFQRQLGPVGSKVSAITNGTLVAKVFLPFVRTPTNLLKFAGERSPAAPLLKEWRKDFLAGGARRDVAISRMLLGTGFGMAIYEAALSGRITGSAPSNPKKARLLYADGWKPYSIRLGDKWYSYRRFDPFSTTIGVAADMATLPEGMSQRQRDDKATLLVASIMGNLASKTWLSGLSDLVSALDEPDRYAGNLLERLAGSFTVPSGVSQVTRILDPVQRQTGSVGEAIQNRIPGLSNHLLPRRDIWGREIVNEGGVGPDIISPAWQSKALNDPVNRELMALDYAPGQPAKYYTVDGKPVDWSPQQYDRLQELAGNAAHDELSHLVASPDWREMDDTQRTKAAKKIVGMAREDAREAVRGSSEPGDGDPWSGFPDDGTVSAPASDPWRAFPDAE